MDDLKYGTRTKRGDWAAPTNCCLKPAPIWLLPPNPMKIRKVAALDYFFPGNVLRQMVMVSAVTYWYLGRPRDVRA